jgi:hypothetical protein
MPRGRSKKPKDYPPTKADGWFSRADMAKILGMAGSGFDAGPRRLITDEFIRRDGRQVFFHAPTVIRRWAESTFGRGGSVPGAGIDSEEEALFDGSDSPALERWRRAKADLAEIEVQSKRGSLVPRNEIRTGLDAIAARLRGFAEELQREFGPGAIDLLDEALTDCENAIDRMYSDDPSNATSTR